MSFLFRKPALLISQNREAALSLKKIYSKMNTQTRLLYAFLLMPYFMLAQGDFLVTNEGDTLKGNILFAPSDTTNTLRYQSETKEAFKTFAAHEVLCFKVGRLFFQSVDTSGNHQGTDRLIVLPLSIGALSLYKYQEKAYFLKVPEGRWIVLERRPDEFYGISELNQTYRRDYRYRDIMAYILRSCPKVAEKARYLSYTSNDLTGIVNDFNDCMGSSTASFEKSSRIRLRYGLKGGLGYSSLRYLNSDIYFSEFPFQYKRNYSGGVFMNFTNFNDRWAVQPEIRIIRKGGFTEEPSPNYNYDIRVDYDFVFINTPISIQYTFPQTWGTPYIHGGATFSLGARRAQAKIITLIEEEIPRIARDEYGWRAGFGVRLPLRDKLRMVVEYEHESSLGNKNSLQHSIRLFTHHLTLAVMIGE
jgi:hypothetical protein